MYQAHVMSTPEPSAIGASAPIESAILDRVTGCIERGCVICIEHAEAVCPHLTRWECWERPRCFDGDLKGLYDALDGCRRAHADHHIRLNIQNLVWRSRLSLVVHRPH